MDEQCPGSVRSEQGAIRTKILMRFLSPGFNFRKKLDRLTNNKIARFFRQLSLFLFFCKSFSLALLPRKLLALLKKFLVGFLGLRLLTSNAGTSSTSKPQPKPPTNGTLFTKPINEIKP